MISRYVFGKGTQGTTRTLSLVLICWFFGALILPLTAHAHSAVLWCYVENNRVFVEAFFMGGKKIQGAKIIVVDGKGKKLLTGTTDKDGLFDFEPPIHDDMTVVLRLGEGHGADFTIDKQDFQEADATNKAPDDSRS